MPAPFLIPLLAAGGGIALQAINERNANNRRQSIINSMLADQSKRKTAIAAETMREAKNYEAPVREPALQEQEQAANADYTKALTSSANASTPEQRSGKLSVDFTKGAPTAWAATTARSKRLAELMAKVRAPGDLRVNEAVRRGGVTEDVGSRLTDAQLMQGAGQQDAQSVRVNPWVQFLGQGLEAYGGYGLANSMSDDERLKTIKMMMAANGGGPYGPAAGSPFTNPVPLPQ